MKLNIEMFTKNLNDKSIYQKLLTKIKIKI